MFILAVFLQEQEEQSTASLLNGIAELGPSTPVLCCSQGCRVRAGLYLEDQKTQPKTPGRTDKNICKGHSWNLSRAPGEGWEPEPGLSAAGASLFGLPLSISPNQSPGCPAWEEVINYITSSMLLLSKGHCGTDRYQRVSRAIDFVYGFVR